MTKYEIAKWLTPGLTPIRLTFTSYGGSVHGVIALEAQDVDDDEWKEVKRLGEANGIPNTIGEEISSKRINQFTGE